MATTGKSDKCQTPGYALHMLHIIADLPPPVSNGETEAQGREAAWQASQPRGAEREF